MQQNFNGFMKKWSEQFLSFFPFFYTFFCLMYKVIITDLYIATIHSCSSIIWLTTKSLSVLLTLTNGQLDIQLGSKPSPDGDTAEQTKVLAAKMGNLVILRKGHVDTISDGNRGQLTQEKRDFQATLQWTSLLYSPCSPLCSGRVLWAGVSQEVWGTRGLALWHCWPLLPLGKTVWATVRTNCVLITTTVLYAPTAYSQ